jgi:hypothetical protein
MLKVSLILSVFIIIFLITHHTCQITGKTFYEKRIENGKTKPKVYDIGHRILPNYSNTTLDFIVKDLFVVLGVIIPFLLSGNLTAFKEYLSYYIVVILIRCLTINVTILPKIKDELNPIDMGYYDHIFSGHFATLFLATLIFYQYGVIKSPLILVSANLISTFIILTTRSHYTIDIIVSMAVVLLIYTNGIKINL